MATAKPKITPKQAKIIKAKVEAELLGKTQRDIARTLYPNSSQAAAEVEVSKNLNKPNVQEELQIALAKHGLTADSVVAVVADGMTATKETFTDKDGNTRGGGTDHSIRLKAGGMAAQFMGIGKNTVEGGVHFHQHTEEKKAGYEF